MCINEEENFVFMRVDLHRISNVRDLQELLNGRLNPKA